MFKMTPLFGQRNQLLMVDWANLVARAFSVAKEDEIKFLTRLLSMIHNYRESFNNFEFVFALEGKGKQERRKLFSEYKFGQRKSLAIPSFSFRKSSELLRFLGGKTIKAPLGEADDAIATYLSCEVSGSDQVAILTEDKDLWQLIQDPYRWVASGRRGKLTESEVSQILKGIAPKDILLYKVLCGDNSDNIPRVPQLRNKSAIQIVKRVTTLKDLLQFVKKVDSDTSLSLTKKEKDNLKVCKKQLKVNYKLAKLRTNLDLEIKQVKPKPNKLKKFLAGTGVFSFSKEELKTITGKNSHAT